MGFKRLVYILVTIVVAISFSCESFSDELDEIENVPLIFTPAMNARRAKERACVVVCKNEEDYCLLPPKEKYLEDVKKCNSAYLYDRDACYAAADACYVACKTSECLSKCRDTEDVCLAKADDDQETCWNDAYARMLVPDSKKDCKEFFDLCKRGCY